MYQDPEYAGVTQGSKYAEICGKVPESAWMAFVLFPHCEFFSTWTRSFLFQCLYKTKSFSLQEYETVILKRQNLIFSIVAEVYNPFFRVNVFTRFQITFN